MFWKFGFHNASSIDSLFDKDDVSLEALLDEDDLLQDCKAQNTRLIDYFQRPDVLHRLLGYVTGDIEGEEKGRFKYPYVATEVLCSDIWSIVETCINSSEQLLAPFWESVLDRSPDDMRTQVVMASHFTKINSAFLAKKPAEMLAFIRSQPNVVEKVLRHIETPSFVDLLARIIQLDEYPENLGVLEWLSQEKLISRLVERLSPYHTPTMHSVVSELIKGIISISAPSPGAGLTEGLQNGPASNLFARQLAQRDNIAQLVGFILDDFPLTPEPSTPILPNSAFSRPPSPLAATLPNRDSISSSGVHAISVIVELIRKNNSDYFEPYLFHTLRTRLIQVQSQLHMQGEDGRNALEEALKEMVNKMGVIHLAPLLEIMSDRLEEFQARLRSPRFVDGPVLTTIGPLAPLTFERFRICELYAELLHCSNMALLNRAPQFDRLYDSEGRLQGGLSGLEELSSVIASTNGSGDQDNMETDGDELEPAQDFPVSAIGVSAALLGTDSDEDMSDGAEPGSSDDEMMEEIAMHDDATVLSPPASPRDEETSEQPALVVPSSPNASPSPSPTSSPGSYSGRKGPAHRKLSRSLSRPRSAGSRRSTRILEASELNRSGTLSPVGDKLKRRFVEVKVLSTLLDLFFSFPWNNFLHSVVYDLLHQILTGRVDSSLNRELTVALFRDARLLHRILEAQKQNDRESSKPKHVRLGYMGHLTLISEDVITALEHYPPDLRLILAQFAPQPDWDDYVGGRYHETKKKDSSLLGGGKPAVTAGAGRGAGRWKVDEEDAMSGTAAKAELNGINRSEPGEIKGEFRRVSRPTREGSADFGPAPVAGDDDGNAAGSTQFARYLAQEISSAPTLSGSHDDDDDDDDDDDGGWLSQSNFDLRPPPISVRHHNGTRRPLSSGEFDDVFQPHTGSTSNSLFDDTFGEDDDVFGPFSDSAVVADSDPFSSSGFSDDANEVSFEDFGEFGDFQAADGELTPTGSSWTLASTASLSSGSDDGDDSRTEMADSGDGRTQPPKTNIFK